MPDVDDDDSSSKPIKKEKKSKRKRDEEGFPLELLEAAKKGGDEARAQLLEQMVDDYYKLDYEDKVRSLISLVTSMTTRLTVSDDRLEIYQLDSITPKSLPLPST
jgi:hypothetical protein